MPKHTFLTITVAMMLALCGCHDNNTEPPRKVLRTVVVYMEGRNNLSASAYEDLDEMRRAQIPANGRLLAYTSISGESHPRLIEIYAGGDSTLVNYPAETSALEPAQMKQVLADARRLAPSEELGMVLWSHSSGWRQKSRPIARAYGLENSWKQMSITSLASALEGADLDFIFFDTCFMGSVEVAYELRNVAPRMVGSVCEVPADGMPYHLTVAHLFNRDIDRGLTDAIDTTVNYYEDSRQTSCPSTLSLIDLTRVADLIPVMKQIINNGYSDQLQRFATSGTYKNLFFDLGQYIEALGGDSSVLNDIVIHERHTTYNIWGTLPLRRCSGLSVYVPGYTAGYDASTGDYNTLAWARDLNIK